MDKIIDHIYISDWNSSNDINLLEKNNIKAVITVEMLNKPEYILNYYRNNGIDFMQCRLYDHPDENIYKYFDITSYFIDTHAKQKKNVLIHCFAGISRSSAIIINYIGRMMYNTTTPSDYIYDFMTYNYSSSRFIYNYKYNKCQPAICVINYILNLMKNRRKIVMPNIGFLKQLIAKFEEYKLMCK